MATEKKSNTLAQVGPVAAPAVGALIAILLIAAALLTSSVGEGSTKLTDAVATTRKALENPAVVVTPMEIPLTDNVSNTFARTGTNDWKPDAGNKKLLAVPVKWEVVMDAPIGDLFAQMDENQDGLVDNTEFSRNMPSDWVGTLKDKFNNWDRQDETGASKPDGFIDRKEFADEPTNDEEQFALKQKADPADEDGKFLTSKVGEISTDEEYKWDRTPFDGKIDLQEYKDRYKPHDEVAFGPVVGVEAKVDAATMQIVVTWSDPAVDPKPKDIAFKLERRAPQTVAKREAAWRQEMVKYSAALSAWDAAFEIWWKQESDTQPPKTNKELYPDRKKAKEKFEEKNPKPLEPKKPSEWEPVTNDPITGNEYRDSSFELDVTYTYAVTMATKSKAMRNQKVVTEGDWSFYSDRQATEGHPIIVRNRIEVTWNGVSPPNGTHAMSTWHKLADKWYRVEISESLAPDSQVGKVFSFAELKERGVKLKDIAGAELNALEVLPKDAEVDFSTGFEFVALGPKNSFILNSDKVGDFEIDKAVKGPAIPDKAPTSQDATEVRCLALKNAGKDATFEITRWLKVGQVWLRVVLVASVKTDADVGREVSLASPGEGVTVYDATGLKPLTAAELKPFGDAKVDLKADKYTGVDGRKVTVGGQDFDLFGTLYKG